MSENEKGAKMEENPLGTLLEYFYFCECEK